MNNVDLPKLSNEKTNNNDGFKEMIKYVTNKNGKELFYLIIRLLLIIVVCSTLQLTLDFSFIFF